MDYAFPGPSNWLAMNEEERFERGRISPDICVIDGTERYIRGRIELPVLGCDELFVWGVWVSVSEASLARILEL
jgi:hypothetical protein